MAESELFLCQRKQNWSNLCCYEARNRREVYRPTAIPPAHWYAIANAINTFCNPGVTAVRSEDVSPFGQSHLQDVRPDDRLSAGKICCRISVHPQHSHCCRLSLRGHDSLQEVSVDWNLAINRTVLGFRVLTEPPLVIGSSFKQRCEVFVAYLYVLFM